MSIVWAILLVIVLLIAWVLTVLTMPGNWLMVGATALYAWLMPPDQRVYVGWTVVIVLLVLATIGELLEFFAGSMGAATGGGSKRGVVLSLFGSFAGGVLGLFVPIPVPIIGSLIGAIIFASVGALVGALLGELWKGRTADESLHVAHAAFWGRLLGTLGKIWIASVMVVVTLAAIVLA